ncbi:MAG: hypothetical protein COB96_06685 [Planctomycetota bacterium]|nr:MAG: hypothetical protein COB96_06685 [Planctomycetota bacterium]
MQNLWAQQAKSLPRALRLDGSPDQYSATNISLPGDFTVEVWVRLADGISNADGVLGRSGGADFNFHDARARFYGGPQLGDLVIAKRRLVAGAWTHVAVSRDQDGLFCVFIDGELDNIGAKNHIGVFSGLDIGRTSPPQTGTAGELMEFRVWDYARSEAEIRASFRRRASSAEPGLVAHFPFGGDEMSLAGGAYVAPIASSPRILDESDAVREEEKLNRFRAMLEKPGDAKRGEPLFRNLCLSCHTVAGEGAGVGPPLDGSSHRDLDSLLRAIATPNAAFEPGYRTYRLETHGGEMYEGYLVKQDELGTTIGFMGGAQIFVEFTEIRRGRFLDRSFMLPGLLDTLDEQMVADLFAKLSSLD